MRKPASALAWIALLVASVCAAGWAFSRAFPLAPTHWRLSHGAAKQLALSKLEDLGELPANAFVVTRMDESGPTELRLLDEIDHHGAALNRVRASRPAQGILVWEVTVYAPGARPGEWSYQARLALDGEVLALRRGFRKDAPGKDLDEAEARTRAIAFLEREGFDLAEFGAPEVRREDLTARTDLTFRFPEKVRLFGKRLDYGVAVGFAGRDLTGYWSYQDDPEWRQLSGRTQSATLVTNFGFVATFILLPILAVPFLKRYHAGEIGVRRGLQIGGIVLGSGILLTLAMAAAQTEGAMWGNLSRRQVLFVWSTQFIAIFFIPLALLCFFGWSAGESFCRERWSDKLAAFDALFHRDWTNRTFALSSLRGTALGALLGALLLLSAIPLPRLGAHALWAYHSGPFWQQTPWPGLGLVAFTLIFGLYHALVGKLFFVEPLVRRLGRVGGSLVAAVLALFLFSMPLLVLPMRISLPIWMASALFVVVVFLRYDLLASLLAGSVSNVVLSVVPLVLADSSRVQVQGWIPVLVWALPMLVSLRFVTSDRAFVYRYEDVPPHVRRIAERERQRVELETARNIQSSILPELPPQLNGIELAHTYLPATEVGGDFYDVLALEDGRVAVAVGDVAGHGVSSGLVMSMAKSALAVQVSFDPRVESVFATLNRMVFQSARKRLLATLCYALVDPHRREIEFASAGHIFPYRVTPDGRVEALESIAYPLGVRPTIDVVARRARLESGDIVFLCSDGLVEARREGSDECFGFERVERALKMAAGSGATAIRDVVLAELHAFTGEAPREDDLTLLVLRLA